MHRIQIDRGKPLSAEPRTGHNRYHPDIEPVLEVAEGEEVVLETRDALDGQLTPKSTIADFGKIDAGAVHPLTGPVFVKGAEPGDLIEIEFVDIVPQPTAFSCIMPGLGFLRDVMVEPFLVNWTIRDGFATSDQIPGVRIPGAPFMGVSAVAPSAASSRNGRRASSGSLTAVAWRCRPIPPAQCQQVAAGLKGFARCRRGRTAAISM